MNARDELATVIHRRICEESLSECLEDEGYCVKAAEAILAAGYRKPRVITTAEDLDALPVGSMILDTDPDVCTKNGRGTWTCASSPECDTRVELMVDSLPATVLHEPEASK